MTRAAAEQRQSLALAVQRRRPGRGEEGGESCRSRDVMSWNSGPASGEEA